MKALFPIMLLILCIPLQGQAIPSRDLTVPLPAHYPTRFEATGQISEIENRYSIIISGLRYKLASYAKINTKNSKYATLSSLSVGQEVGFKLSMDKSSRKITEIWVLPKGSIKLH